MEYEVQKVRREFANGLDSVVDSPVLCGETGDSVVQILDFSYQLLSFLDKQCLFLGYLFQAAVAPNFAIGGH
jgi:hypothetical protein